MMLGSDRAVPAAVATVDHQGRRVVRGRANAMASRTDPPGSFSTAAKSSPAPMLASSPE
jgi:hypothetical protein